MTPKTKLSFGLRLFLALAVLPCLLIQDANADTKMQKIGSEVFFKTNSVQVAVRPNAAFGHTTANSTLSSNGFNPQASGMGFIAKRDVALGWTTGNVNGCFFMPGTPYEGWGIRIGSSVTSFNHDTNTSTGTLGNPYHHAASNEYRVTWTHTLSGVQIDKLYRIPLDAQGIYMDITLTNVGGSTLSNVYYGRGVDPDDDNHRTNLPNGTSVNPVSSSSIYVSQNTVVAQHSPATPYALVTAKFNDVSLLALFSDDTRVVAARESSGFDTTFDPKAVYDGSGFLTSVGSQGTADAGMNLAIRIPSLAAGASTSFTMAYLLSEEAVEESVASAGNVQNISFTTAHFIGTSGVSGTGYYIVVPRNAAEPSAAQIKAGVNYGSVTVVTSGSGPITQNVNQTFFITGLSAGTEYDLYFVVEDNGSPPAFTTITKSAFATLAYTAPSVSATASASSITGISAVSGGTVENDGSDGVYPVTERGVVWSTATMPTLGSNMGFTTDGTGLGSFSSSLTGLSPATTYYVRAYATNSIGTGYGPQVSFTTEASTTPSVTTTSLPGNLEAQSVTLSGNVTSDGGAGVTERGIAWGIDASPTSGTASGSGTGPFSVNLSGLTPVTTYYFRAYATNPVGTSYGNEYTFTTPPGPPSMANRPPQLQEQGEPLPAERVITDRVAGQMIEPIKVRFFDAWGNPVGAGHEVSVSINKGEFASGTLTALTDAEGYATFGDLHITIADPGYELTFTVTEVAASP